MSKVKFWAFINDRIRRVSGLLDDALVDFYSGLQKDPSLVKHLSKRACGDECEFYVLRDPVCVVQDDLQYGDDHLDQVRQRCLEESNRMRVNPITTKVRRLANMISSDFVYLVIAFPDPRLESLEATRKLRQDHSALFKCLQVTVGKLGTWEQLDVEENLRGGYLTRDIKALPHVFKEIQDALAKPRVYNATSDVTERRDFGNAHSYGTQFGRLFTPAETDSPTVISDREFATFYNLLRCFDQDVSTIVHSDSSSLKASNFTVHFIQPPFFSEIHDNSRGFRYQQEKSWGFPIFVDTMTAQDVFRKFTPRSDWMVISPQYEIPFVVSEVISDKSEKDRSRMLVEAIALARAGRYLMKSTSNKPFFVVAIYVNAKMVASRYIVMQTGDGSTDVVNASGVKPVSIHRKDFDLREVDDEVDFLREMYNLATQITALSSDLDQRKEGSLRKIRVAAGKVLSLSSTKHLSTFGSTIHSMIQGGAGTHGPQDEDDLGVFEAEDIQNVLHQMDYEIEFIPWGHPQLAVVADKTGDQHGYLKFLTREKEVELLRYLTAIESPSNHTVSGVRFWPVERGTVISMPVAGGWLTSLRNPNEQLWSVALQLVEAVGFMHDHNVAHMDLKPQNVIIPAKGGRLSIIDFSVSIRVSGPDTTYRGVVGTEDYIAPEVREGWYKPLLADLWSCGRTLEELCACCLPSENRTALLEIARRLMNRDPEARPKMSTVLEWMTPSSSWRGGDDVVPRVSPAFQTASVFPLCA